MRKAAKAVFIFIGSVCIVIVALALLEPADKPSTRPIPTPSAYSVRPLLKPLPVSDEQLFALYNPPAKLIDCLLPNSDGTAQCFYRGKYHVLELDHDANHQLIRAYLKFDHQADLLTRDDAAVVVPAWVGLFVKTVTRATAFDALTNSMRKLGLDNAWSPTIDETVSNGVRLRRYIQHGDVLVLEAVAMDVDNEVPNEASTAKTHDSIPDPRFNSSRQSVVDSANHWASLSKSGESYSYEGDTLILDVFPNAPVGNPDVEKAFSRQGELLVRGMAGYWKDSGFKTFVVRVDGTTLRVFPL